MEFMNLLYLMGFYFFTSVFGSILALETSEEQKKFTDIILKSKNVILIILLVAFEIYLIFNRKYFISYAALTFLLYFLAVKVKLNFIIPSIIISLVYSISIKSYEFTLIFLIYNMFYYSFLTSKNMLYFAKKKKLILDTDQRFKGSYFKLFSFAFRTNYVYYIFFILYFVI